MRFSKEKKAMWLEDWSKSSKSARVYARENGINPQTFVNWTKAKIQPKACFVEVPAKAMQQPVSMSEILIEKGDVKIHIPLMIGRNELRAVMEGLGTAL